MVEKVRIEVASGFRDRDWLGGEMRNFQEIKLSYV